MAIENEMIEISVAISGMMNYDIMIPAVITPNTFQEVIKRLKAIQGMIPKTAIESNGPMALLKLEIDESEDIVKAYEEMGRDDFSQMLVEKYSYDADWNRIASTIGRLRKRISNLKTKAAKE